MQWSPLQQLEKDIERDYQTAKTTKLCSPRLAFKVLYGFTISIFICDYGKDLPADGEVILRNLEDTAWKLCQEKFETV